MMKRWMEVCWVGWMLTIGMLLSAAFARGQEPIHVKGNAGEIIRLDSKAKGEVKWYIPDARLMAPERKEEIPGIKRLIIVPKDGGEYRVLAIELPQGILQEYVIAVKGQVPPGPGPGPTPPPPPDTLETKIAVAYAADVAAGKGGDAERKTLAFAFESLGPFLPSMNTTGDVKQVINVTTNSLLKGKLPNVVAVVDAHLVAAVPEYAVKDTPLNAVMRGQFVTAFKEISVALNLGPQPPPGPVTGFRVLMVEESSANMTREQLNILNSTAIRAYLLPKVAKDGNQPAFRKWDKDVDTANEPAPMRKLWESVKPKLPALPAIVISTDQGVQVLPLPVTEAATLDLLKKYGG